MARINNRTEEDIIEGAGAPFDGREDESVVEFDDFRQKIETLSQDSGTHMKARIYRVEKPSNKKIYVGNYEGGYVYEEHVAENYGGGSLTALPIIETQAGDVSAYIPTNVISITDGQIFLETELFNSGVRPAVNPGISVSRVGGSAQIKAMKKVAGSLKLEYSQYRELQAFSQFGSDLDTDTKNRLAKGERIVAVLKQGQSAPLSVENQVIIIYAVINNYLKDIAVERVGEFETELFAHIASNHPDITDSIKKEKVLTPENEENLKKVLADFAASF